MAQPQPELRKLRPDLTDAELARLDQYGSISFRSAGAIRKKAPCPFDAVRRAGEALKSAGVTRKR
jgi:hypothetical protein